MKIYLHIGYPKTGSTFLQYNFLNKLSQNFIGRPYSLEYHQMENLLTNSRYDDFQKNKKKIIHYYFSKFKKNKINILSIEDLLKFSFFQKKSQNNPHKNIKRLKEIFLKIGDVKVIFVIRSPNDLIKSFYYQYYYNDWKDNKIYHHNIYSDPNGLLSLKSIILLPAVSKSLLSASGSFGVTYWSGAVVIVLFAPLVAPTIFPAFAFDDNTNIVFVAGVSVSSKVILLILSVLELPPCEE